MCCPLSFYQDELSKNIFAAYAVFNFILVSFKNLAVFISFLRVEALFTTPNTITVSLRSLF